MYFIFCYFVVEVFDYLSYDQVVVSFDLRYCCWDYIIIGGFFVNIEIVVL